MDDATDNATVEITNPPDSPKVPSQQCDQSAEEDQTLEEILARPPTDLLRTFAASINQSALREASKTEEFNKELKRRLFRVIFRTYVWSTARLTRETEIAEGRLTTGIQELLAAEREQGRSSPTMLDRLRTRLLELMTAVSRAAEMFTQF